MSKIKTLEDLVKDLKKPYAGMIDVDNEHLDMLDDECIPHYDD